MKAEDIPPELVAILDKRAGRAHSPEGIVMQTLAEILTEYDRLRDLPHAQEAVWDRHYEAPSLEDEAAASLDPPPVSMPADEVRPGRVL